MTGSPQPPRTPLSDREEQLLLAVVTGERAGDDPEVAAAAEQNVEFAAALAELQDVQGRLATDAERERELLAEAEAIATSSAEESTVARTLRQLAEGGGAGAVRPTLVGADEPEASGSGAREPRSTTLRRGPARIGMFAGAAAAAVLLLWAVGVFSGAAQPTNDDHKTLGDEELVLRVAADGAELLLSWTLELPGGGIPPGTDYTLAVFATADTTATPRFEKTAIRASAWRLTPAVLEGLPQTAIWQVTAFVRNETFVASHPLF